MPVNPKLLAAMRAHKGQKKGTEPSPTKNPVGAKATGNPLPGAMGQASIVAPASTEPAEPIGAEQDETPALDDAAKALKHLQHVQKRAKGALAVHAKLAVHHAKKAFAAQRAAS